MKYAMVIDNNVRECWEALPVLHPDLMAQVREVADEVECGWKVDDDGDIISPDKPESFEVWDKALGAYVIDTVARDAARREEIMAALAALDASAIRPLRATVAGTATAEDTSRLAEIETQAAALRVELAGLETI